MLNYFAMVFCADNYCVSVFVFWSVAIRASEIDANKPVIFSQECQQRD